MVGRVGQIWVSWKKSGREDSFCLSGHRTSLPCLSASCFCFVLFYSVLFVWPHCAACGILVPQPGIKPGPLAVRATSPNHWTTRELPQQSIPDWTNQRFSRRAAVSLGAFTFLWDIFGCHDDGGTVNIWWAGVGARIPESSTEQSFGLNPTWLSNVPWDRDIGEKSEPRI